MEIGNSVKVLKITGKYKKYMFTIINGKKCKFVPKREGIIVGFPQKGIASVVFPASKVKDSPYYQHIHEFYIKDLIITKHSRNSQISLRLDNLREKYKIKEESMK